MRYSTVMSLLAATAPTALAAGPTQPPLANTTALPVHFAMVLFPHFQALDVFGPLDVLNTLAMVYKNNTNMHLSVLSRTLDPVSTSMGANEKHRRHGMGPGGPGGMGGDMKTGGGGGFGQSVVPTNTFKEVIANGGKCPPQAAGHGGRRRRHSGHVHDPEGNKLMAPDQGSPIDVLLVPGGGGTRKDMSEEIEFVKAMYPKVKYIISICTGASILARAGVLDGKKATTNKKAWEWVLSTGPNVNWQPMARWVEDGNIWTSSGISAGTDVTYAWVSKIFGKDASEYIAAVSEYEPWKDASRDPFAEMYGLGKANNGTTSPPQDPAKPQESAKALESAKPQEPAKPY